MFGETGAIILAAIPLLAAAGVFVAVKKKSPGGAVFSLVVGIMALIVFFNLGRDLAEQRRRDSIRKTKRKYTEGVFAERSDSPFDTDRRSGSNDDRRPPFETRGNPYNDPSNFAATERARLNPTIAANALSAGNAADSGNLNPGRVGAPPRRKMPMAPPPENPGNTLPPR